MAERSGKNVGQVLIRWALQHGTSVIPKSTSPARIRWLGVAGRLAALRCSAVLRGLGSLAGCMCGTRLHEWRPREGLPRSFLMLPSLTRWTLCLLCVLRGNLEVFNWELSAEDYAALSSLPDQQRMVNGAMWLVRGHGMDWEAEMRGGPASTMPLKALLHSSCQSSH